MKSYGEYCAVAKTLDVIGERWTLLIVRELSYQGPSRYTDLRDGLPGIATNLLADRLRSLEAAGVVSREEAPPPVATTLFSLTPRGEELRPVLETMMRWGLPFMTEEMPDDVVRSQWLVGALELLMEDRRPTDPRAEIELRIGDRPISLAVDGGSVEAALGSVEDPGAVVSGPPDKVLPMLAGKLGRSDAEAAGVRIDGDPELLDRVGAGPA
jgi:DNA-binding HxlR family transcriptional regulator